MQGILWFQHLFYRTERPLWIGSVVTLCWTRGVISRSGEWSKAIGPVPLGPGTTGFHLRPEPGTARLGLSLSRRPRDGFMTARGNDNRFDRIHRRRSDVDRVSRSGASADSLRDSITRWTLHPPGEFRAGLRMGCAPWNSGEAWEGIRLQSLCRTVTLAGVALVWQFAVPSPIGTVSRSPLNHILRISGECRRIELGQLLYASSINLKAMDRRILGTAGDGCLRLLVKFAKLSLWPQALYFQLPVRGTSRVCASAYQSVSGRNR